MKKVYVVSYGGYTNRGNIEATALALSQGRYTYKFKSPLSGKVVNFDLPDDETTYKLCRTSPISSLLAYKAVYDAILNWDCIAWRKFISNAAVFFSNTLPSMQSIETLSNTKYKAGVPFQLMTHTDAMNIASIFNTNDRVEQTNGACSGSLISLINAAEYLLSPQATTNIAICGGCDEVSQFLVNVFTNLGMQSQDDCSPFKKSCGTMLAEAGSCFILIASDKKPRHTLAEYIGGVIMHSSDLTSPDANIIDTMLTQLLEYLPDEGYLENHLITHGTGTKTGDEIEAEALKHWRRLQCWSYKKNLGHTLAASGLLELGLFLLEHKNPKTSSIKQLVTFNNEQINSPTSSLVIKQAFGLGGVNAAVALSY